MITVVIIIIIIKLQLFFLVLLQQQWCQNCTVCPFTMTSDKNVRNIKTSKQSILTQ